MSVIVKIKAHFCFVCEIDDKEEMSKESEEEDEKDSDVKSFFSKQYQIKFFQNFKIRNSKK